MIGHLDCSTGVSGDKFLGALLDAGSTSGRFTQERLQAMLSGMVGGARAVIEQGETYGIRCVRVSAESSASPEVRSLPAIKALLGNAGLPPRASERASAVFELMASVESKIHGCTREEVHFHEIGAVDSIMDVAGVCLGLDLLGIDELVATRVAVGGGTLDSEHGRLPVPAPATAALLEGVPTEAGCTDTEPGELTTPTGAALLRVCVDRFGPWPAMTPAAEGYGAGTRDIGIPNVCRLVVGMPAEKIDLEQEQVWVLETSVDHLSGEAIGFTTEQLLREGALDVWTTAAMMKKGRPAYVLSLLARAEDAEHFAQRLVALTGTLGVRRLGVERYAAHREEKTLSTEHGRVSFKIGPGSPRPEADDVARIARDRDEAFEAVARELRDLLGDSS